MIRGNVRHLLGFSFCRSKHDSNRQTEGNGDDGGSESLQMYHHHREILPGSLCLLFLVLHHHPLPFYFVPILFCHAVGSVLTLQ